MIAALSCALLLNGCGTKNMDTASVAWEEADGQEKVSFQTDTKETQQAGSAGDYINQLRVKYASAEKNTYAEPMYNLPDDYEFVFENISDEVYMGDVYSDLQVFADAELTIPVDIAIEPDYDNHSYILKPGVVFNYETEDNSSHDWDGTWGTYSKFYLVQSRDLTTNEAYEKPVITVFTIKKDLQAPTLSQSVADDGCYKLTWSAVQGADYYDIYSYDKGFEYAELQYSTEELSCTYNDFKPYWLTYEQWISGDWEEEETEELNETQDVDQTEETEELGETQDVDRTDETQEDADYEMFTDESEYETFVNRNLDTEESYFVVARSKNGKSSGMSNLCDVAKIANQIPHIQASDQEVFYGGTSALVLPTYWEVEMLDGSVAKLLLDYRNAVVKKMADNYFRIEVNVKNVRVQVSPLYFEGMDYDAFMQDMEKVYDRQDKNTTKSVTQETDIHIPYVPEEDIANPDSTNTDAENTDKENTDKENSDKEDTDKEDTDKEDTDKNTDKENTDNTTDNTTTDNTTDDNENTDNVTSKDSGLEDTIYASSALSEWIAYHMLNHEEQISLRDFPEASDDEYLLSAVMEAYQQNPLIGIMDSAYYDYSTDSLNIGYLLDKKETVEKQNASIAKAQEIAQDIITGDMSDFEKEEAINRYLCQNASYDEDILDYINKDGSISDDALMASADSFLPYGVLVNNVGVCESYSEAFLLIARSAGLDAVIETGRLDGVNHEWNRVKVDDSWCILDVTNNDSDYLPNSFFNLSDETAKGLLIPDRTAIMQSRYFDYAANDEEKEYYYQKGQYAEDKSEAVPLFEEVLSGQANGAIRVAEQLNSSDVEDIVGQVGSDLGLTRGAYYYDRGVLSIVTE